jgi:hypothetical protein
MFMEVFYFFIINNCINVIGDISLMILHRLLDLFLIFFRSLMIVYRLVVFFYFLLFNDCWNFLIFMFFNDCV